jgi:hypothetical protein
LAIKSLDATSAISGFTHARVFAAGGGLPGSMVVWWLSDPNDHDDAIFLTCDPAG